MATGRITREFKALNDKPIEGVNAKLGADIYHWEGFIQGPSGSPYEGGTFVLSITFPYDYPLKPPEVVFKTPIYHPNIGPHGEICLDGLTKRWTPKQNMSNILTSLYYLLSTPDPDDALSSDIGSQYKSDRSAFEATAREWTQKHAVQA